VFLGLFRYARSLLSYVLLYMPSVYCPCLCYIMYTL
jgi:hypothetical protein